MAVVEAIAKAKGSAPGPYLGYGLQPVRLFYHLLTCSPDALVGLEHVDDVSVHYNGKVLIAEQSKSALSQNPVSNWAPDLWKTFANWIANIEAGHFDPDVTKYQLYVSPAKNARNAKALSDLTSESEIDALVEKISKQRDGLKEVPACNSHLQKFLDADIKLQHKLVRNFELVSVDDDPLIPIKDHLSSTIKAEILDTACKYGIGDAKSLVEGLIRDGKPPLIKADAFRNRFTAFISKHDSEKYLHSLSEAPTDEVVQHTIASAPVFIKQLDLVNADIETKTRGASDFLRASSDRTRWAEDGLIYEGSLDDYDDRVRRRHFSLQQELAITNQDLSLEDSGRLLYVKCCQIPDIGLERRVVPNHFLSGSLNNMADRCLIGWHSNYEMLLSEEDS